MRRANHPLNCFRTGDISILQVDVVVNPTNETMDDNSPMCQRIFSRAGSALKIEIFNEIKGRDVCSEMEGPYVATCVPCSTVTQGFVLTKS